MKSEFMVLSAAHLTKETLALLEQGAASIPVYRKHGGQDLLVPVSVRNPEMPEDLSKALAYASSHNCEWVLLDRDCEPVPGLPTYEQKKDGEIRWNGYGNGELYLLNADGQTVYRVSEGDGSNLSHSDILEGYRDYWMSEMYELKKAGDRDRKATDGGQWLETEMIKETEYTVEGVIRRMMECDLYGNRNDWTIISAEYAEFLLDTQCRYRIGETYWAANPEAGRNAQSPGILTGWTADGKAILQNKRWGRIYATVRNLDEHN